MTAEPNPHAPHAPNPGGNAVFTATPDATTPTPVLATRLGATPGDLPPLPTVPDTVAAYDPTRVIGHLRHGPWTDPRRDEFHTGRTHAWYTTTTHGPDHALPVAHRSPEHARWYLLTRHAIELRRYDDAAALSDTARRTPHEGEVLVNLDSRTDPPFAAVMRAGLPSVRREVAEAMAALVTYQHRTYDEVEPLVYFDSDDIIVVRPHDLIFEDYAPERVTADGDGRYPFFREWDWDVVASAPAPRP